ncbi:MAG: DUF6088 family protein, partial [Solirubrobacteraceae bacterium]
SRNSVATHVRERVDAGGERYWSHSDFRGLSAAAVAHVLSRLTAEGVLQRVRKGLYYRPKMTAIGLSMPTADAVFAHTMSVPLHPSGLTAANGLGFTTQNPARREFATPASGAPGGLGDVVVRTRRPLSRLQLNAEDGALLELLRDRGRFSDLSPEQTAERLLATISDPKRFKRLADAAHSEPPRVRAMLGALGEQAGVPAEMLEPLRDSLNPLSRFDFGVLGVMPNAREWQSR